MESLYFLIPIALLVCAGAVWLLLWAIDSGQYDDLDKEAWRVLADDDPPPPEVKNERREESPGKDRTGTG